MKRRRHPNGAFVDPELDEVLQALRAGRPLPDSPLGRRMTEVAERRRRELEDRPLHPGAGGDGP